MRTREFVSNSVGVCEHTDVNGGHALCVEAQAVHPSPWPLGELGVGIKRRSRWGSLSSDAKLEFRGRGRHSELLFLGNSGLFGVLPKDHSGHREATALPTCLQVTSQGLCHDKIRNGLDNLRMTTVLVYLYLI